MVRFRMIEMVMIILFIIACEHQGENIPISAFTTSKHIEDGWSYYVNGNYDAALNEFISAKIRDAVNEDAYNGLGWTYAKLHYFDESISHFSLLLSITESDAMKANIFAGLAMTYGSMQMCITNQEERKQLSAFIMNYADSLIGYDSNYKFDYDNHVNMNTVRAVTAQSFFNTQDFLATLEFVNQYLDVGFKQLLETKGIIESRKDTLQAEVVSSTWMTGNATLHVIYQTDNGSFVNAQIVDVVSIEHAETNVKYTVVDFIQGGNSVTFCGNPLPQEKDQFIIQYKHADDYGTFLCKLLDVISQHL